MVSKGGGGVTEDIPEHNSTVSVCVGIKIAYFAILSLYFFLFQLNSVTILNKT